MENRLVGPQEMLYQELMRKLPTLTRSSVNDRTCWVWRRHWIDKLTVEEIAAEKKWSVPAVVWHLRRAHQVLE